MAISNSGNRGYLKPKVGDPDLIRKRRNGQAVNPPTFMELGGFKNASGLNRDESGTMSMEKGGPQAKKGKPL